MAILKNARFLGGLFVGENFSFEKGYSPDFLQEMAERNLILFETIDKSSDLALDALEQVKKANPKVVGFIAYYQLQKPIIV